MAMSVRIKGIFMVDVCFGIRAFKEIPLASTAMGRKSSDTLSMVQESPVAAASDLSMAGLMRSG